VDRLIVAVERGKKESTRRVTALMHLKEAAFPRWTYFALPVLGRFFAVELGVGLVSLCHMALDALIEGGSLDLRAEQIHGICGEYFFLAHKSERHLCVLASWSVTGFATNARGVRCRRVVKRGRLAKTGGMTFETLGIFLVLCRQIVKCFSMGGFFPILVLLVMTSRTFRQADVSRYFSRRDQLLWLRMDQGRLAEF